jgi:molybdate/tungstate transport system ATP-binding protein
MLKLKNITRQLGKFALSDINIEIPEGQYYVLLGRSGAGKTQLLELIAGLENADTGDIFLDGENITEKKIQERKIGIVFQDYAVFPHMTVFENVAYPLKARKADKKSLMEKVTKAAEEMGIAHILDRSTINLSGGERQRVALARTLVTSPRLLLLDEPLASLDASIKDDMKRLLRKLNKNGQTIIHVTHDYCDAISLAGKVGVIHNGRIIQEGTPDEVFSKPVNRFVARYAGIRNFFKVDFRNENGKQIGLSKHDLRFKLEDNSYPDNGLLIIRSDDIRLNLDEPHDGSLNIFSGTVDEILNSAFGMEVAVNAGDIFYTIIPAAEFKKLSIAESDKVWLSFPSSAIVVLQGGY